jgi:hypothetical protein
MSVTSLYLGLFSLVLLLVSAAAVIASIVLIVKENTPISKAILGVSCYYMLSALTKAFGDTIWSLFLAILFVFQTFLFVCLAAYPSGTLRWMQNINPKGDEHVAMAVDFLSRNMEAFQISMGILAGMILLALVCIACRQSGTVK